MENCGYEGLSPKHDIKRMLFRKSQSISRRFLISLKPKTTKSPDIKLHYRRKIKEYLHYAVPISNKNISFCAPLYAQISSSCLSPRKRTWQAENINRGTYETFKITTKKKVRYKPSLQVVQFIEVKGLKFS